MDKFRRVEEKYLLNKNKYIKGDVYPKYAICNIYFDNDLNESIINSLEKPIYKEKVRIRSYGVIDKNGYLYLELKKKYKEIVGKRRIKLTLLELNKYLNNELELNNQIFKEIDYVIKHNKFKPKLFVVYDRKSFVSIDNENLRITFDSNLRSRRDNLTLDYNDLGTQFFKDDIYIMEIKTLDSIPLWLSTILSELNIYPASFSKYGEIYKKEMNKNV